MKKFILAAALLTAATPSLAGELTGLTALKNVATDTAAQTTYLLADGFFAAPGCPTAIYVILNGSSPSYRAQLALALTAKASGGKVNVFGTCLNANYFVAEQLQYQ